MSLLSAGALALLALVPLVVLMYILKLRRREIVISSTFLWEKSVDDMRVNTLFQKLRQNLLMYLQILFLLVAIFALSRPVLSAFGGGKEWIMLLDVSASMGATDVEPSRLAAAKGKIAEMVDAMSRSDRMMLVTFGSRAKVAAALTGDRALLRSRLEAVNIEETPTTAAAEAMRVAYAVAEAQNNPEIVIVSDGKFDGRLPGQEGRELKISYMPVGKPSENVSITAVSARRGIETGMDYQVFVGVGKSGDGAKEMVVSLSLNDRLIDAKPVRVEGSEGSVIFPLPGASEGIVKVALDAKDALAVDDVAHAILAPRRERRVLLVTEGNFFLENALRVHPQLEVFKIAPGEFAPRDADNAEMADKYDLVIFDGCPSAGFRRGRAFYINTVPDVETFTSPGIAEQPLIVDWDRAHPLTRFIDFSNIAVARALRLALPPEAAVVVETDRGAAIAAYDRGGLRCIVMAFDVMESDWPLLKASFPLFLSHVTDWICASGDEAPTEWTPSGRPLAIPVPRGVTTVDVVDPRGTVHPVVAEEGILQYPETVRTGIYTVRAGGKESRYAVNLANRRESDVAPAATIEIEGTGPIEGRNSVETQSEIWKDLVLAAIALLMIEWFFYHRR